MNWPILIAAPLVTGFGAGLYWRPSSVMEILGCGLIGALAATPLCGAFLGMEGWGVFGLIALFAIPILCLPVSVAAVAAGGAVREMLKDPSRTRPPQRGPGRD